ncbi:Eco57I restriction-modification methylase domain-containing protein [Streptosporangium sp. NPDC049376]|uniref:Eco57I restriction-modification methylase domain-containing protein n=1 Tax=Streptosporangium sp. NPDC049376 TaxID=3366192 RepID=UPI0037BB2951
MNVSPSDLDVSSPSPLAQTPERNDQHGEVFTRRWVVEMILDLVDYSEDRDLSELRLVEPACGTGAFLAVITQRISDSCRKHDRPIIDAVNSVRAFDLLARNVASSRTVVRDILYQEGWGKAIADQIATAWIHQSDYLLRSTETDIDIVVGNPPYIRIEDMPEDRMRRYRSLWPSMTGRSDIYIGFYEAALRSLAPGGALGFICADRWMRNQYGGTLRNLISTSYAMNACIVMHDVDAFDEQVSAYPAITILRRAPQKKVIVADANKDFGPAAAKQLVDWTRRPQQPTVLANSSYQATFLPHWFSGTDSWPQGSPARLAVLESLSDRFPALGDPDSGVRIGIGIATGADKVFITTDDQLVEEERLLPLAMVRDTTTGSLKWGKRYLVNPWDEHGKLVDLARYPRLRHYFNQHRQALLGRYIARKNPANWYKTIDKVEVALTSQPKLLFPDMKLTSHPVFDEGGHYPHHNLYFITSDAWDLKVLGGLLLSKVAEGFIEAYAVKMRGKTLRFQAQYLRRIRVPRPDTLSAEQKQALSSAFEARDVDAATAAALEIYGLIAWPS